MHSRFPKLLLTALASAIWLVAGASIAEPGEEEPKPKPRPERKTPPPIAACEGLAEGADCSFVGHGPRAVERTGTCQERRKVLVCTAKPRVRPPQAGGPGGKAAPRPAPAEAPSPE